MKKIRLTFSIFSIIISMFALMVSIKYIFFGSNQTQVFASGNLQVIAEKEPLFYEDDVLPGTVLKSRFTVTNFNQEEKIIALRVLRKTGLILAVAFDIKIQDSDTGQVYYPKNGSKESLIKFFLYPVDTPLFLLKPGQSRNVEIILEFENKASYGYQDRSIYFDLQFGFLNSRRRFIFRE